MTGNKNRDEYTVDISVELNGKYDDVVSKLETADRTHPELGNIIEDFEQLLDTVDAIDGGTKSVIVENLPSDMAVAYDSNAVVNALQVLEQYDLVTLEGNTWMVQY